MIKEYNIHDIDIINNDINEFIIKNNHSNYDYFLSGFYGDYIPGIFSKSNYIREKLYYLIFNTNKISTYYINFYNNSSKINKLIDFNQLPKYKFIIYKN